MSIDDKINASMKVKTDKWAKAGRPAPGTVAYIQLFSDKPHYVRRGGKWWAFRSLHCCREFITGTYDQSCRPKVVINNHCQSII